MVTNVTIWYTLLMTTTLPKFIAYYRVSTTRQGKSGLGLDAQREAVNRYLAGVGRSDPIAEFTEIESGKRNDRPELAAALDACRKHKAYLVIAKLDRLARNVAFIANLMDSNVSFVAVDMPEANELMLHIMAAFAQHERKAISQRTREALAAAKERGTVLGNPKPETSLQQGRETVQAHVRERDEQAYPLIQAAHNAGQSLREIAHELDQRGIPTAQGQQWGATSVLRMLNRKQTRHKELH